MKIISQQLHDNVQRDDILSPGSSLHLDTLRAVGGATYYAKVHNTENSIGIFSLLYNNDASNFPLAKLFQAGHSAWDAKGKSIDHMLSGNLSASSSEQIELPKSTGTLNTITYPTTGQPPNAYATGQGNEAKEPIVKSGFNQETSPPRSDIFHEQDASNMKYIRDLNTQEGSKSDLNKTESMSQFTDTIQQEISAPIETQDELIEGHDETVEDLNTSAISQNVNDTEVGDHTMDLEVPPLLDPDQQTQTDTITLPPEEQSVYAIATDDTVAEVDETAEDLNTSAISQNVNDTEVGDHTMDLEVIPLLDPDQQTQTDTSTLPPEEQSVYAIATDDTVAEVDETNDEANYTLVIDDTSETELQDIELVVEPNTYETVVSTDENASWRSYTDVFNADGQLISRSVEFMDGRWSETTYVNGVRATTTTSDLGDAYAWAYTGSIFDGAGDAIQETRIYDDGREYDTVLVGGVRVEMAALDAQDGYIWHSSFATYDENGDLQTNTIQYDNGKETVATYEGGLQLSVTTQIDDTIESEAWQYDEAGEMLSHTHISTDGISSVTTYVDGQVVQEVSTDTNDAKNWAEKTDHFDFTGNLTSSETRYDDGRLTEVTYKDGHRVSSLTTDVNDVSGWETVLVNYNEDGSKDETTRTYDNGRIFETDHETDTVTEVFDHDSSIF